MGKSRPLGTAEAERKPEIKEGFTMTAMEKFAMYMEENRLAASLADSRDALLGLF